MSKPENMKFDPVKSFEILKESLEDDGVPSLFREHLLFNFSRIPFATQEEFDDFLEETISDLKEYQQNLSLSLNKPDAVL